jgi:hypothetical protein
MEAEHVAKAEAEAKAHQEGKYNVLCFRSMEVGLTTE